MVVSKRKNSLVLDYSCWHLRRTLSFPFYWTGCSEKFSLFASFLCLCWTSLSPLTTASQILQQILIMYLFTGLLGNFRIRRGKLGLYRTSRLVWKSGNFLNPDCPETGSCPSRTLLKKEKNPMPATIWPDADGIVIRTKYYSTVY